MYALCVSTEESSVCGYDKTKKKKNSRHDATISGASCSAADPSSVISANCQLHSNGTVSWLVLN